MSAIAAADMLFGTSAWAAFSIASDNASTKAPTIFSALLRLITIMYMRGAWTSRATRYMRCAYNTYRGYLIARLIMFDAA